MHLYVHATLHQLQIVTLFACLIRHGLSTANVDEKVYTQMPDHTIPLVDPVADRVLMEAGKGLASLGIPPSDTVAW